MSMGGHHAAIPVDMKTSLVTRFGSVQRTLGRAYFGVMRSASGATPTRCDSLDDQQ